MCSLSKSQSGIKTNEKQSLNPPSVKRRTKWQMRNQAVPCYLLSKIQPIGNLEYPIFHPQHVDFLIYINYKVISLIIVLIRDCRKKGKK